jgi:Fe-S-cluster containining protein
MIYPVRPSQCRSWPFWPGNLNSAGAWNTAAQKCAGINRGRLHSCEEIQKIRKKKGKATEATENTEVKS